MQPKWQDWPCGIELSQLQLSTGLCPAAIQFHSFSKRLRVAPRILTSAEPNDSPSAETTVPLWLVPETLRDALIARLDRAPDARKVAQLAAVIGREFSYELLCRLSPLSNEELLSALQQLMQSDIIQARDGSLHSRFAFRHALLRDAAYESLLKSARRENHAKVAEIIANKSPDVISGQPELIAYHYDLAGHAELAVHYWTEGGRRA